MPLRQDGAEFAAEERRPHADAERQPRLALARHGEAVEGGGDRRRRARMPVKVPDMRPPDKPPTNTASIVASSGIASMPKVNGRVGP